MRSSVDRAWPLAALILLAACGGSGHHAKLASAPPPPVGPAADYPIVLGAPFTIGGVTYTPADKLNYDQVGYAVGGTDGGTSVSAANRTLPLPSYVEVTSLDTGRTILVRAERRGPMSGDALVELSPGAAAQLGIGADGRAPVRVRRVNPPEIERAMLRRGDQVPARMDTPKSLVAVLLRKLGGAQPVASPVPAPAPILVTATQEAKSAVKAASRNVKVTRPVTVAKAAPATPPEQTPPSSTAKATKLVQVGAFANKTNAEASAAKVGGKVERSGHFWIVRMGPYAVRDEVTAALAKAHGAGYSDARIQRVD